MDAITISLPSDLVAEITCLDPDTVKGLLPALAERGLARHIAARDLWQLTPDGRTRHAELLLGVSGSEVEGLREHYERFLELNDEFKALCGDWQLRGGQPNDHSDAGYDAAVIDRLVALNVRAVPLVTAMGEVLTRLAPYGPRLTATCAKVVAGDGKMFTGVMCGSYHDVWMELHEDLILTQGIDRAAEGSF